MAAPTDNVLFRKDYADDVHQAFQRKGPMLRGKVRERVGIKGSTFQFDKLGKGTATSKDQHGNVVPMNPDHAIVTGTIVDKYAPILHDKLDELKTNPTIRQEKVNASAWACGRVIDEQLIDEMANTTTTVETAGAMTKSKAMDSIQKLLDLDVQLDGDIWGAVSPKTWFQLMNIPEFSSLDYVGMDQLPFVKMNVKDWMGCKWFMHTYLSGGTAAYVWHKSAIGFGMQQEITTEINYLPEKTSNLINTLLASGAKLIDVNGVCKITVN